MEEVDWLPIEAAPKDGTVIGLWSPRQPDIIRLGCFGIPKPYKTVAPCWISRNGNALTNLPSHWIRLSATPANQEGEQG